MPKVGMAPIRRTRVIRAVIESVAEQSLEALTMNAFGRKAGVSKGVVNYYFAGKRDLLLHSFHAFLEFYNQQIVDLIQPDMRVIDTMGIVLDVCFPDGDVALLLWKHDPKIEGKAQSKNGPDPTYFSNQKGGNHVQIIRYYHRCRSGGLIHRDLCPNERLSMPNIRTCPASRRGGG